MANLLHLDFAERVDMSTRLLSRYPDRVPVIILPDPKASNLPSLNKYKYLVPRDVTLGKLIYEVRKYMRITKEQAIYLVVGMDIPPVGQLMDVIYNRYKDKDGFLYMTYTGENTFG